jgi:hypothetical protein
MFLQTQPCLLIPPLSQYFPLYHWLHSHDSQCKRTDCEDELSFVKVRTQNVERCARRSASTPPVQSVRTDNRCRFKQRRRGLEPLNSLQVICVRNHSARVVWQEGIVWNEAFFGFLSGWLALWATRIQEAAWNGCNLSVFMSNCGPRIRTKRGS